MTELDEARYPFGQPSTRRGPRRPSELCRAFVLGVYPSAVHVRWTLPRWYSEDQRVVVGSLAIDDEPEVFWDGGDAADRVSRWETTVGFRGGDADGEHGQVRPAGNGTSGESVRDRILVPLGLAPHEVWFTDAVDRFFVKRAGPRARGRQQGDVIEQVYNPFAQRAGLPLADLPARPAPAALVRIAVEEHRDRLRSELLDSKTPLVITLGEEARQVMLGIAAKCSGPPTSSLDGVRLAGEPGSYGARGEASVSDHTLEWMALVHPGQRSSGWRSIHDGWIAGRSS